jgi:cyanophycin synthetase
MVTADEASDTLLKSLPKDDETVCVLSLDGQRWIVHLRDGVEYPIMPLSAIPGTMMGLIGFNESNALFAVALGLAHGLDITAIRSGLAEFDNTAQINPGRFNFIGGFPFTVLLDYAHNPEGVLGLCDVVNKLDVKGKRRLVVFNLGNRSKTHIDSCVAHLANCFDEFVIGGESGRISRCKDYEGEDPFGIMLDYFHDRMVEVGVSPNHIFTERNVQKGIAEAMNRSGPGDLLVLMTEYSDAMAVLTSTSVV